MFEIILSQSQIYYLNIFYIYYISDKQINIKNAGVHISFGDVILENLNILIIHNYTSVIWGFSGTKLFDSNFQ